MKIAFFTDILWPPLGGVEQHVLDVSQELANRGHEIKVFAPGGRNKELGIMNYGEKGPLIPNSKFIIHSLWSIPLTFIWPGFRFAFPLHLYFSLKKWRPDVVHWHAPGPMGLAAIILSKLLKIKLVGTFHGYFMSPEYLKSSQPTLAHFNYLATLVSALGWRWAAFLYNQSAVVITPTHWVARDLEAQGFTSGKSVIPTVGSLKEFEPRALPEKISEIRKRWDLEGSALLYVGRVSREKSLDLVLKALKGVKGRLAGVSFLIVGDGNAVDELKELARQLGIESQVKFLGRIGHDDLPQSGIYEAADLFVIPSTSETLSIVTLEAMTKGLPVVAPSETAVAELIEGNGLLFKAGDVADLSGKILSILSNEVVKKEMGKKSRARAQEFSLEKTVAKLEKLYAG